MTNKINRVNFDHFNDMLRASNISQRTDVLVCTAWYVLRRSSGQSSSKLVGLFLVLFVCSLTFLLVCCCFCVFLGAAGASTAFGR